jgi:hypothetical protein
MEAFAVFLLWILAALTVGPIASSVVLLAIAQHALSITRDPRHPKGDGCWVCLGPDGPFRRVERFALWYQAVVMVAGALAGLAALLGGGR